MFDPSLALTLASVLARSVAFLGVLSLVACRSSEEAKVFLGPVVASSFQAPPPSPPGVTSCAQPARPELPLLWPIPCAVQIPGELPIGLTPAPDGVLLAEPGGLRILSLNAAGCPVSSTPLLSTKGLTGPVAWADRLWFAQAGAVQVWRDGELETYCSLAGVRSLAAFGARAWAITGKGLHSLEVNEGSCSAGGPWWLPGSALAIAASTDTGLWVALTQPDSCRAAPVVNRYRTQGELDHSAPVFQAEQLGLCSVTVMMEHLGKLLLLDGACGQGALVDVSHGEVEGIWEVPLGQTPVGVIPMAGGALLATAAGSTSHVLLKFSQLPF
ncbi:MAG: hypothetical protein RMJ98_06710 [Myxococcales bacterium]|nr:hypothetical protein [Polyangiaceae bacterium]MDW8248976.1 hypothetical protein [Myxococcales bacterium]